MQQYYDGDTLYTDAYHGDTSGLYRAYILEPLYQAGESEHTGPRAKLQKSMEI